MQVGRRYAIPAVGATLARLVATSSRFAMMARNAGRITDFFNIPTNRVVELETRVEI
jgi:K+ transporter